MVYHHEHCLFYAALTLQQTACLVQTTCCDIRLKYSHSAAVRGQHMAATAVCHPCIVPCFWKVNVQTIALRQVNGTRRQIAS